MTTATPETTATPAALLSPKNRSHGSALGSALGLCLGLGSLLAGCGPSPPAAPQQADPAAVIARYKDGEIRRGDIQRAIDTNLASQPQPVSAETRRAIVKKIVERRVRTQMLLAEALSKGYAEKPTVLLHQAAAEDRVLAEDLLAGATAGAAASDAVVAAEIDRRLAETPAAETRKFSHIYLKAAETDAAARQAAAATLAKIEGELAGGASFGELAEKYSQSVMARGGGQIDWTPASKLQAAARGAVFGLAKEGDLSPVVSTADGLHLFRLDGIRQPSPLDAGAHRAAVRQELDAEARNAALRGRREQALDAGGAEFAPAARLERLEERLRRKEPLAAGAPWLARWQGGELGEAELAALHGRVLPSRQTAMTELRWLVENRLLAAERRAQGLSPELEKRIAEARRTALIDSYRADLIDQLDTPPSAEEIARYYRGNAASALALRDFQVDALFYPQQGESVAEVYAAGEEVVGRLREGVPFDEILAKPARPEATVCRETHGVDLEAVGLSSIRLRKALANLTDGEISPAIYLERPVDLAPSCRLTGRGLVFVRLRGIGALSPEAARPAIVEALVRERVEQGVAAVQERLIAESRLEILVPEG